MTTIIETDRLLLRTWKKEDLAPFYQMNADSRVMQYFPATLSKNQSDDLAQKIQVEHDKKPYGLYAVEVPNISPFIGFIGLHYQNFEASFTPCIEIGWRLAFNYWGKGYATEGAKAVLAHAFSKLKLPEIVSFTAKINSPSIRVMEKIGMQKALEFDHPKLPKNHPLQKHVLYQITNPLLIT